MEDSYSLRGFGVRGYRSFGGTEMQYVAPIDKIMLLAGQNNAGKSNALNALFELGSLRSGQNAESLRSDFRLRPDGSPRDSPISLSFAFETSGLLAHYRDDLRVDDAAMAFFEKILVADEVSRGFSGLTWFDFNLSVPVSTLKVDIASGAFISAARSLGLSESAAVIAFLSVSRAKGDNTSNTSLDGAADLFVEKQSVWEHLPPIVRLEAARRITSDGSPSTIEEQVTNGANLVWGLADLRSPRDSERAVSEPKWQAITDFVRNVLEDPAAEILIDSNRTEVSIRTSGRAMALGSLGSGIEQVLIIAATATVHSGVILAVEEPEIYLHPSLQRRLVEFLAGTQNQYLVSTHSAHILNAELATISHVTNTDGWTTIQRSSQSGDIARIASDLGYRASDIVQANYVVWVEGPSDRTYVRHWLRLAYPTLIEGAHFTIMFYGGALLSHLAADDPEVEEFIALNRLGRTFAIVMDRDKPLGVEPNETKLRVLAELQRAGNWGWVTEGYTIENYVEPEKLAAVFSQEYPNRPFSPPRDPNVPPLRSSTIEGRNFSPSKVVLAKRVVAQAGTDTIWWRLDVLEKARELGARIALANGLHQ